MSDNCSATIADSVAPLRAASLKHVFHTFAAYATRQVDVGEQENVKFTKLCKDAKLVGRALTTVDVDLIFAKVTM